MGARGCMDTGGWGSERSSAAGMSFSSRVQGQNLALPLPGAGQHLQRL